MNVSLLLRVLCGPVVRLERGLHQSRHFDDVRLGGIICFGRTLCLEITALRNGSKGMERRFVRCDRASKFVEEFVRVDAMIIKVEQAQFSKIWTSVCAAGGARFNLDFDPVRARR